MSAGSATLIVALTCMLTAAADETFSGRLSDDACGASHQKKTAKTGLTDRECVFACIKRLAKYALVEDGQRVVPIVNQDARGLPWNAGRQVKLTGERKGDAIVVTKVDAFPGSR